jgi:hypothetical protein
MDQGMRDGRPTESGDPVAATRAMEAALDRYAARLRSQPVLLVTPFTADMLAEADDGALH